MSRSKSAGGYLVLQGGLSGYLTPGGFRNNNVLFIEVNSDEGDQDVDGNTEYNSGPRD